MLVILEKLRSLSWQIKRLAYALDLGGLRGSSRVVRHVPLRESESVVRVA